MEKVNLLTDPFFLFRMMLNSEPTGFNKFLHFFLRNCAPELISYPTRLPQIAYESGMFPKFSNNSESLRFNTERSDPTH